MTDPDLSIVVVVYNMDREAPRTLHSLSRDYQLDVDPRRYEVIVVDNGSETRLDQDAMRQYGDNFRYVYVSDASPSPAAAMNHGAALAKGRWLGLLIDGARIVTPGMVSMALCVLELRSDAVVETIGFHLGPDLQNRSVRRGYNAEAEDELLQRVQWPSDGYRLFEICAPAASSSNGWCGAISESNCMFMPANDFREMGGYDERFDGPGGGYVNLDFYCRTVTETGLTPVRLVEEANFHQTHGGVATGLEPAEHRSAQRRWDQQYTRVRGRKYEAPTSVPVLCGRGADGRPVWVDPNLFAQAPRRRWLRR